MSAESLLIEPQRFIARHVQTVEQLEILCLPADELARSWQIGDVFRSIQSSGKSVANCLNKFAGEKLVASGPDAGYRLA